VAKSLKIVTPESLAKLLVEKKWLTAAQAKQLLHEPSPAPARPPDDEMLLAPLEDELKKSFQPVEKKAQPRAPGGKTPPAKGVQAAASPAAKSQPAAKVSPATGTAKPASAAKGIPTDKAGKPVAKIPP